MEYLFTNDMSSTRTDEIVYYLAGPRLWIARTAYPDLLDWLQRVHEELSKEVKRAMLAYMNRELVGVVIYQQHKTEANTLEIKNLTVRPDNRGRHVASFLMRNAEIEGGIETQATHVVCDAKADNFAIRAFLLNAGYRVTGKQDIYGLGTGTDLIFRKPLLASPIRL